MKILNVTQIKEYNIYTIKNQSVFFINLMEASALHCSEWIMLNTKSNQNFVILCGNGNNGGDGLALARILANNGRQVKVYLNDEKKFSQDTEINFARLPDSIKVFNYKKFHHHDVTSEDIIIDAIFGIGLNKKINGIWADIINAVNRLNNRRIAIDIPSGVFSDVISEDNNVFKADDTLSFKFYKKSFLHPETGWFCGRIHVLDTEFSQEYVSKMRSTQYILSHSFVKSLYEDRGDFKHKGHYSKVVLVGGSYGKSGAIQMAAKSALRSGAGLTYVVAPEIAYGGLESVLPEVIFINSGEKIIEKITLIEDGTYGIGPGYGTDDRSQLALEDFFKIHNQPVVLDTDAINILSERKNLISWVPVDSILMPYIKEFDQLFGKSHNSFDRLEVAIEKAMKYRIYIILKDHYTQIVTPQGEIYYSNTCNSCLTKGGSAEVLTGVVTSLLSQGYSSRSASVLGVWLYDIAADFALEKESEESLLASDLIDNFGKAFKLLQKPLSK